MSNTSTWLIRHGQSTINAGQWADDPHAASLTELGKQQAKACSLEINTAPDLIITSRATRALETAQPIMDRWPNANHQIWPIQEIVYLSPIKLKYKTPDERKQIIADYWNAADPFFCDGEHAESFNDFLHRVKQFDVGVSNLQGFTVVVGHGQFFKAYLLGKQYGFTASKEWMQHFRNEEVNSPIKNTEIIKLANKY